MWKDKLGQQAIGAAAMRLMPFFRKNRYLLIVLIAGLLLLAVGTPRNTQALPETENTIHTSDAAAGFSVEAFEAQLKERLALIEGAGRVELMLSLQSTEEAVYASNIRQSANGADNSSYESTLSVLSDGSYGESPVRVKSTSPTFRGAVILCDGADNIQVRLAVTEAVGALCGIGADKITVLKMQS